MNKMIVFSSRTWYNTKGSPVFFPGFAGNTKCGCFKYAQLLAKGCAHMVNDREFVAGKLDRWRKYMENYHLPSWDALPDMDLYIDQLVVLVGRYLDLVPHSEADPIVTASIVNNYVRLRVMPPPVKKRYSKRHLAYAVMVCALKQCLTLTEIQRILPPDMDDAQTQRLYNDFAARVSATAQVFIGQVLEVEQQELVPENEDGCTALVLHSAVSSVLYKLLTEKLTALEAPQQASSPASPSL